MPPLTVNIFPAPAGEHATCFTSASAMRLAAQLFWTGNSGLAPPAARGRSVISRLILTASNACVATQDASRRLPPLPTLRVDLANDWIEIQLLRYHGWLSMKTLRRRTSLAKQQTGTTSQ